MERKKGKEGKRAKHKTNAFHKPSQPLKVWIKGKTSRPYEQTHKHTQVRSYIYVEILGYYYYYYYFLL